MKKTILILMLASAILLLGCDYARNANRLSIKVQKTETKFRFEASFPTRKTTKVVNYLEEALSENQLLDFPNQQKDSDINLGDSLKFHLYVKPGSIEIIVRKTRNSRAAYQKMENVCLGIKNLIVR